MFKPCILNNKCLLYTNFFFFFFHWHYSPLRALACRTMSFHFFLFATNSIFSLPALEDLFLLPLSIPSSSWAKIFLGILSSSILSRWPNQLIHCPFIHFTIFSPLLNSSSSRLVRLFHSLFSYYMPTYSQISSVYSAPHTHTHTHTKPGITYAATFTKILS